MSRNILTSQIVNELLKYTVFTAMVGSVLIAPNAAQLGDKALGFLDKRSRKLKAEKALKYMQSKQLISHTTDEDGKITISVTEKGRQRAVRAKFDEMQLKKPKKWDRKWRLITFDVPEKDRKRRSKLSGKLNQLGFYQLQRNIWIHPYPCELEIEVIKQVFRIPDRYVVFAKIGSINRQKELTQHFKIHA